MPESAMFGFWTDLCGCETSSCGEDELAVVEEWQSLHGGRFCCNPDVINADDAVPAFVARCDDIDVFSNEVIVAFWEFNMKEGGGVTSSKSQTYTRVGSGWCLDTSKPEDPVIARSASDGGYIHKDAVMSVQWLPADEHRSSYLVLDNQNFKF